MIIKIKPDSMDAAKMQVRQSHKNGFTVSDIKSVPQSPDDKSKINMTDYMYMSTPYTYKDEPLIAFCEVDRGDFRIDKSEVLHVNNIRLFTKTEDGKPDQDLEDLYQEDTGNTDYIIQDTQGFDCYIGDVKEAVANCAVGTVCFPHVMSYDEYMSIQSANKTRMVFLQVNAESYGKYLDRCENEIQSGIIPYVGKVKDMNSIIPMRLEAMDHMSSVVSFDISINNHSSEPELE